MEAKVLYELCLEKQGPFELGRAPTYFTKELLREGTWVHPSKKFRLMVTRERMLKWIARFKEMLACDISVTCTFGHSYSPKDIVGTVADFRVEGHALVTLIGVPKTEDRSRLVTQKLSDVSVCLDPDFRDGKGNRFGEVIEHIALFASPPEQDKDFIAVPMGNDKRAYIWHFEAEAEKSPVEPQMRCRMPGDHRDFLTKENFAQWVQDNYGHGQLASMFSEVVDDYSDYPGFIDWAEDEAERLDPEAYRGTSKDADYADARRR